MPSKQLAAALWDALRQSGYETIYAAAKITGIESKHLGQILKGEVSPTLDTVERILAAVGWEVVFRPKKD